MRYHPDQSYTVDEAEDIVNKMENYLYDNQERFYIKSVYSYYSSDNISSTILLNELRAGALGPISIETPEMAIVEKIAVEKILLEKAENAVAKKKSRKQKFKRR